MKLKHSLAAFIDLGLFKIMFGGGARLIKGDIMIWGRARPQHFLFVGEANPIRGDILFLQV